MARLLAHGRRTSSGRTTATTIPELGPAPLGLRVGSFFTSPYDMGAQGALWSVQTDSVTGSTYVQFDSTTFESSMVSRFDSNPWATGVPGRSFSTNWSFPTGDPFGATPGWRWTSAFGCTSIADALRPRAIEQPPSASSARTRSAGRSLTRSRRRA